MGRRRGDGWGRQVVCGRPCYNSESTEAQRPAGSVCAHAGDGRPYLAHGSSMQYNRRSRLGVHVRRFVRRERVITNRVAYTLYAGLMPQRQAITMIIIYCSKPQQNDAVTPTPLTHRSHTCMRALALGHDRMSSYRVMHTDYICTHVHTVNTIYVHRCTIPCNPHLTVYYHFRRFTCRQIACAQPAVSSHASAQSATHA